MLEMSVAVKSSTRSTQLRMGPATGATGTQPVDVSSALDEVERSLASIESSLESGAVGQSTLKALDEAMRSVAAHVNAVGSTVAEKFFSLTYRRELLNPKLLRASHLFSQTNGNAALDGFPQSAEDAGALSTADLQAPGQSGLGLRSVGLSSTLRFSTRDQTADAPAERSSGVMSRLAASVRERDASSFIPRPPPLLTRVSHATALLPAPEASSAGAQGSDRREGTAVAAVVHSGYAALAFTRASDALCVLAFTQPALPPAATHAVRLVHNGVTSEGATNGSLLALCTPTGIAVVALPRAEHLASAFAESSALPALPCCVLCDGILGATGGVLDALWHPLSPRHLLVLCVDAVRVYAVAQGAQLTMRLVDTLPIPSSSLVPVGTLEGGSGRGRRGGASDAPVAEPVAMRMGAARGWEMCCIYILCTDGGLRIMCPYLPPDSVLPLSDWSDLLADAQSTATMEFSMLEGGAVGPQEAEQARLASVWLTSCFVDIPGDSQFKRYIGSGGTHTTSRPQPGASMGVSSSHVAAVQAAAPVLPHLAPATAGSSACDLAIVPANISRGNPCAIILFTDGSVVGIVATHPVRPCFQDRRAAMTGSSAASSYGATLGLSALTRTALLSTAPSALSCGSWLVVHASHIGGMGRAMDHARVHVSVGRAAYAGGAAGAGVSGTIDDWTAAFRPSAAAARGAAAGMNSAASSASVMGSPSRVAGSKAVQTAGVGALARDVVHVPSIALFSSAHASTVQASAPVSASHCTAIVCGRHAAYEVAFPWLLRVDELGRALSGYGLPGAEEVNPVLRVKESLLDHSSGALPFEIFRSDTESEDILGLVAAGTSLIPALSLWTCTSGTAPRVYAVQADTIMGMLSPAGKGQGDAAAYGQPEPSSGNFLLRGVYSPLLPLAAPLSLLQESFDRMALSPMGGSHQHAPAASLHQSEDLAAFAKMHPLEAHLREAAAVLTAGLRKLHAPIASSKDGHSLPSSSFGQLSTAGTAEQAVVAGELTAVDVQAFVSSLRALTAYARAVEAVQKSVEKRRALLGRVVSEVKEQGKDIHDSCHAISTTAVTLKQRAERAAARAGNLQARAQALSFALQLCSGPATSSEITAHKDLAASLKHMLGMQASAQTLQDKINRVQAALDVADEKSRPGFHPMDADEILASLEAVARTRAQTHAQLHALELDLQRRVAAVHAGASQLAASAVLNA